MPATVVVGGQFGSEGKGKVAHWWADRYEASAAVRVGGPNSGHTAIRDGETFKLRMLPTAALLPGVDIVLPAGSYLDVGVLFEELERTNLDPARLYIDPNAIVVSHDLVQMEDQSETLRDLGSTLSGTGAAVIARAERGHPTQAKHLPELKPFLSATTPVLRSHLRRGARVVIEGTQGFGLSVLHSPCYPYATSRDTTAAGFVAEAGLSPLDVDQVVMVVRSFPIRVAGPSGPLPREVSWEYVTELSGSSDPIEEFTTVTGKTRRVAQFDAAIVNAAIAYNMPTHVVLNHVDYFDASQQATRRMSHVGRRCVLDLAVQLACPVTHVGVASDHLEPFDE